MQLLDNVGGGGNGCRNLKLCKFWLQILNSVDGLKYDSGHSLKHADNGKDFWLECLGRLPGGTDL